MAHNLILSHSASSVAFDALIGQFNDPKRARRTILESSDGSLQILEWSNQGLYEIAVNNFTATQYANIINWWEDQSEIRLYYDHANNPSDYIDCIIINETQPMQLFGTGWHTNYAGTLLIHNRSSSAYSSSSFSASYSKSISTSISKEYTSSSSNSYWYDVYARKDVTWSYSDSAYNSDSESWWSWSATTQWSSSHSASDYAQSSESWYQV